MTNRKEKNSDDGGKMKASPSTSDITPPRLLDITSEVCPMTFVRTRLALDGLASGGTLTVRLRGEEPRRSVPENAASLGHEVISVEDFPDGTTAVTLRKS